MARNTSDITFTPDIIDEFHSDNPDQQIHATQKLRRLLSGKFFYQIDKVIEAGIIPKLIEFLLRDDNSTLQFEAAYALTLITSGESLETKIVVDGGAVPIFIRMLDSASEDVQGQVVVALGNIAGDCPELRDHLLDQGILTPLLQLFSKSTAILTIRNAVWALSNLCKVVQNSPPKFEQISSCLHVLFHLLFHCDVDVLVDACWALSYIAESGNDRIQAVIEAGVCNRLHELMMLDLHRVAIPALRAYRNICKEDVQKHIISNCNVLPDLLRLMRSTKDEISTDACRIISYITAGNWQQIQAIIDANIFPALISALSAEFEVIIEAATAIANATSGGSPQQVKYIVEEAGCIPPLCKLLILVNRRRYVTGRDLKDLENIVEVSLKALENILRFGEQEAKATGGENFYAALVESCEAVDDVDFLQSDEYDYMEQDLEISERAFDIMLHYFTPKPEDAIKKMDDCLMNEC